MGKAIGGLMESHKSRSPIMGGKGDKKESSGGTTVVQGGSQANPLADLFRTQMEMANEQSIAQQNRNAQSMQAQPMMDTQITGGGFTPGTVTGGGVQMAQQPQAQVGMQPAIQQERAGFDTPEYDPNAALAAVLQALRRA